MEYQEHLQRTKMERMLEFRDRYYELINSNNRMKIDVNPEKITPSVSQINVRCGIEIHNILDLYAKQLVKDGKTEGFLVNYDGGILPYVVKTEEYLNIVERLAAKSVFYFESFCNAQNALVAAKNVEEVFAVVYPPEV